MNKRVAKIVILVVSLILCPFHSGWAKVAPNIGSTLSHNQVWAILQDSRGFMWFGTKDGLNRYDGYNNIVFRYDKDDSASIGNNYIQSLFEDTKETRLWVGTDDGIYIYNLEHGGFQRFKKTTVDGSSITGPVKSIVNDNKGNIWISAYGTGIYKYNTEKDSLTLFHKSTPSDSSVKNTIMTNHIWNICVDHRGAIWASTFRNGICRHSERNDRFDFLSLDYGEPNNGNSNYSILSDKINDCLWIGTQTDGLVQYNYKKGSWSRYDNAGVSEKILNIHSIAHYSPNELILGADNGVFLFNTISLQFKEIKIYTEQGKCSYKSVLVVYPDKEGGCWIGSYYNGIYYLSRNSEGIEHYYPPDGQGKIVTIIKSGLNNTMWVGTNDGCLSCFNPSTRTYIQGKYKCKEEGNIMDILEEKGYLWLGLYSGGLVQIDKGSGRRRIFLTNEGDSTTITSNTIYSLERTRCGALYIGTMMGLDVYNSDTGFFSHIPELKGVRINDIFEDHLGLIWIATFSGIYSYNANTHEWRHWNHLYSNKTTCIYQDRQKRLWFGTEDGGLCRFDYGTHKFSNINHKDGLPDDYICSIEEDYEGNLWVSTNKALFSYNVDQKKLKNYFKGDEIYNNQYLYRSSSNFNGQLYFGGVYGFNIISPDILIQNTHVPRIVITNMRIFNQNFPFNPDQGITLKYDQSTISFDFASLSYIEPTQNMYAYYLEGFDKEWNYIGNNHSATYTNLPNGVYTFHVKGTNNDGIWNETGTSIRVVISPPFWKTPLMYIVYFLLITGIIALSLWLIKRDENKSHQSELLKYKLEKDKELYDYKINFFANIAHEIRTPLCLIKAPLEEILTSIPDESDIKENLMVMGRNTDRLHTLVNQLLDFRKIEQDEMIYNFVFSNLNDIIESVSYQFKYSCKCRHINLVRYIPKEAILTSIDYEGFTKVVSNLLSNALKHAVKSIEIYLYKANDSAIVKIVNDGDIIAEQYFEKIFEPFFQIPRDSDINDGTGIGLATVKKIVEKHNGTITVESSIEKGTSFIVSIPMTIQGCTEKEQIRTGIEEYNLCPACDNPILENDERYTILVVEDDVEFMSYMKNSLGKHYNVLTAENGKLALNILDDNIIIDLIISDIAMPELDGIKLCQTIREEPLYCHIPIILLTARTDLNSKKMGLEYGADVYIEKPFMVEYLKSQIKSLLKNRNQLKELFLNSPYTPPQSIARSNADLKFLNKLNGLIMDNLRETNNLIDLLANSMSVSRSSLHKKIKAISGMTPNDYIQLIRLKKSAELLGKGEYQISEIAYLVGFNTPSYFSKCFFNQFGILPRDFINKKEN